MEGKTDIFSWKRERVCLMFSDSSRSQELLLLPEVMLSSAKGWPHWYQWPGTQLEAGPGCFWIVWHWCLINCTIYSSYFMTLPEIWLPICDQNIVVVFSWVKSREAEVVCTAASKPELCNLPLNSQALFLHTHSLSVFCYCIYLYMCVGHTQACVIGYRWRTANYHVNWEGQTQVTKLGSKPL